jgi:hypothetical protein
LGADHPHVTNLISSFGILHFRQGQMEKAEFNYLVWNAKKQAQIQRYFPFLSDNERNQFYENWELCISDGNSNEEVKNILEEYSKMDKSHSCQCLMNLSVACQYFLQHQRTNDVRFLKQFEDIGNNLFL